MKTQMLYAKEGTFTPQMQIVADKEQVSKDFYLKLRLGKIIIPANIIIPL